MVMNTLRHAKSTMEISGRTYHFSDYTFDVDSRELRRGTERLVLNARYFDALALLLENHGKLVRKEQFFEEVWGDVVVSDSALTQCIKDIRKVLDDDSSAPRFVETVPRHGYRFIGDVKKGMSADVADAPLVMGQETVRRESTWRESVRGVVLETLSGTAGGGLAGLIGGVFYGFALAHSPGPGALGTLSILVVMMALTAFVGILGGFGVSLGWAAARYLAPGARVWTIAGAALGGMLVGTGTKLLGVDAFNLLLGLAPAGITGGLEGAVLGAAIGTGLMVGGGTTATVRWKPVVSTALCAAAAGIMIPLAGGRLLGGSLELVARSFATSRLELDALGRFFGELEFGLATQVFLGSVEGLIFGAGLAAALVWSGTLRAR